MKISVTQDNIEHGLRGSSTSDPVALALQDAGFMRPYVGLNDIITYGRNGGSMKQTAPTPIAVLNFLMAFDNGNSVKPFDFFVEL